MTGAQENRDAPSRSRPSTGGAPPVASCDTAPCFQIGEEHYENVTEDRIDEILAKHK